MVYCLSMLKQCLTALRIIVTLSLFILIPTSFAQEGGLAGAAYSGDVSAKASSEYVIANPENNNKTLTLNQVRAIFSLRATKWPDGSKITVFVLHDQEPVHRSFLKNTLKMLPHQLRRQWDRYIYSGIGQGPVVVNSVEEMIYNVTKLPGAIGYVEGGVPHEQVLTLSIR